MKRIILVLLTFALLFALSACGNENAANTQNPTPTQGFAQTTPNAQATTEAPSPKPTEFSPDDDYPVPAGYDEIIMLGVFYYDLMKLEGDSGDGLTPREGAELANNLLDSMGFYAERGGSFEGDCVYISFDDLLILDSAMGRECYIYSVGLGTTQGGLMGDNYQVIYRISVDYSGNKTAAIYDDYSGGGGDDDITNAAEWWGTYENEWNTVEINNYNGASFRFAFLIPGDGQVMEEGVAAVDPDDNFKAEYGTAGFFLSYDNHTLEVIEYGTNGDLAHLAGQYFRSGD